MKVLDIGTGSGAISVCLAKEHAAAQIVAVDISPVALDVARLNARASRRGRSNSILAGRSLRAGKVAKETFDLIVSNPPYIRSGELSMLAPEIREWEPTIALDGGPDGLDTYRRIIAEGHKYLATGGSIVLEIGADMAADVADLFSALRLLRTGLRLSGLRGKGSCDRRHKTVNFRRRTDEHQPWIRSLSREAGDCKAR